MPILRLDPVAQYLNGDARVTVQVFLDNGAALAAGSWGIRYDPLVVQAESCQTDVNVANAFCNPAAEPGLVRMTVLGLTGDGRTRGPACEHRLDHVSPPSPGRGRAEVEPDL